MAVPEGERRCAWEPCRASLRLTHGNRRYCDAECRRAAQSDREHDATRTTFRLRDQVEQVLRLEHCGFSEAEPTGELVEATAQARAVVADKGAAMPLLEIVAEAVDDTFETMTSVEFGNWYSPAWTFVQRLRSHPQLRDLTADQAADHLEPILCALGEQGRLPHSLEANEPVWTSALGDYDSAGNEHDPLEDFLAVWSRPPRPAPFAEAARRSLAIRWRALDVFGADLVAPRRAGFRRFLAFCAELHSLRGGYFFLPVEKVAQEFGTNRRVVSRWREEAVARGFIRLVRPAKPPLAAAVYQWAQP